jgi:uncharacterized protein (DUF433 family)
MSENDGTSGVAGPGPAARGVPPFDRVTFETGKMGGRACIRGLRITVAGIVRQIADGASREEILDEFPDLEPEDIRQALAYAAWLASEDVVPA